MIMDLSIISPVYKEEIATIVLCGMDGEQFPAQVGVEESGVRWWVEGVGGFSGWMDEFKTTARR